MKPPTLPKLKIHKKAVFQVIGIILALILGWSLMSKHVGCVGGMPVLKKTEKPLVQQEIEQPPVPVKVYKVARVNFRDTLPALGSTRSRSTPKRSPR